MELLCFEVVPGNVELRAAPRRRQWMDETSHAAAYRCLPLVLANLHGWEMLCPYGFEFCWTGGAAPDSVHITPDQPQSNERSQLVTSHFGNGILTFSPSVILRTVPGYNVWIMGPANVFKDGVQALSALIETDWMPFTFTANWKVTRPGATLRFEQGEPFCSFFPLQRGVVASCQPRLATLEENKELADAYHWAAARRELDTVFGNSEREMYQRWYSAGEMPNPAKGLAPDDHERTITARPFRR